MDANTLQGGVAQPIVLPIMHEDEKHMWNGEQQLQDICRRITYWFTISR